jgi:hypothetical protein
MAGTTKGLHVSEDELQKYFELSLGERRECEIEAHLAKCPLCQARAQAARVVVAVVRDWPGGGHDQTHRAVRPPKPDKTRTPRLKAAAK